MSVDTEGGPTEVTAGVAVVIVNYRTADLTVKAVRSVLEEPSVAEVVVVDNASGDGSVEALRAALKEPSVRIVESPSNAGFGHGANLGVSRSGAPLVLLLNSDAVVRAGAVERLAQVLADDDTVGVVAPAVYGADGRTLQPGAFGPLPRPWALVRISTRSPPPDRSDGPMPVGWVSGVAMMVRRSDFDALGGFDPDFTMYFEDLDLCRRLGGIGKHPARLPAAAVVHAVGGSAASPLTTVEQFQRSKILYLEKAGARPEQLRLARAIAAGRVAWARRRTGRPTDSPARRR